MTSDELTAWGTLGCRHYKGFGISLSTVWLAFFFGKRELVKYLLTDAAGPVQGQPG